jgi:hypothetical protein
MKTLVKFIFLVILGVISNNAIAQKQSVQVPLAVQSAFSTKYPQVHLKSWKAGKNQYMASFVMDNKECIALYSKDGDWISTETDLGLSKLPPEVVSSLRKSNYASYHIDDVEDMQTPSSDLYLLKVDNNSGNKMVYENAGSVNDEVLYFSHDGTLVNAVASN